MNAPAPRVWVVATGTTCARWAEPLAAAGLAPVELAWGDVAPVPLDPTALRSVVADVVVLTSAHALAFLPDGIGDGRPAACVGRRTAAAALGAGFDVCMSGEAGGADLAERILARWPTPGRALLLVGHESRPALRAALLDAGWQVEQVVTYEVLPLEGFAAEVARAPAPDVVVVGSPRAVHAFADVRSLAEFGTAWVAVGDTTASALEAHGARRVRIAARAAPAAIAAAVRAAGEERP